MSQLFDGRVAIAGASALLYFSKKGLVRDLLHAMKYDEQAGIAESFGRQLGFYLKSAAELEKRELPGIDYIVPVPMHPSKRRNRGYNQSECFGQGLADVMETPMYPEILRRLKKGETQTGKNRFQRWQAVQQLYGIKNSSVGKAIKGKTVLLVDDVITTGVTLEYCASLLNEQGATVYLCAIAFGERL